MESESVYFTCSSSESVNNSSKICARSYTLNQKPSLTNGLTFENSICFNDEKYEHFLAIDEQRGSIANELSNPSLCNEFFQPHESSETNHFIIDTYSERISITSIAPIESLSSALTSTESLYSSCPSSMSKRLETTFPLINREETAQDCLENFTEFESFPAADEQSGPVAELSNHSSCYVCPKLQELCSPAGESLIAESESKKECLDSIFPSERVPLWSLRPDPSESFYSSSPSSKSNKTQELKTSFPFTNKKMTKQDSFENIKEFQSSPIEAKQSGSVSAELSNHSLYNECSTLHDLCLPDRKFLIDESKGGVKSLESLFSRESIPLCSLAHFSSDSLCNSSSSTLSETTEKLETILSLIRCKETTKDSRKAAASTEKIVTNDGKKWFVGSLISYKATTKDSLGKATSNIITIDGKKWFVESLISCEETTKDTLKKATSTENIVTIDGKKWFVNTLISCKETTKDSLEKATSTEKIVTNDGKKWFVEFGNNKNYIKSLSTNFKHSKKGNWLQRCFNVSNTNSEGLSHSERWIINYDNLNYIKSQLSPVDLGIKISEE